MCVFLTNLKSGYTHTHTHTDAAQRGTVFKMLNKLVPKFPHTASYSLKAETPFIFFSFFRFIILFSLVFLSFSLNIVCVSTGLDGTNIHIGFFFFHLISRSSVMQRVSSVIALEHVWIIITTTTNAPKFQCWGGPPFSFTLVVSCVRTSLRCRDYVCVSCLVSSCLVRVLTFSSMAILAFECEKGDRQRKK